MRTVLKYARYCLIEARPAVQLAFGLRYLAGAVLGLTDKGVDPLRVSSGLAGWLCATIAVYVFNGVTDRQEDTGNGSTRPIASGLLPVGAALGWTSVFTALGVLSAFLLGNLTGLLASLFLFIGYAYSGRPFRFKQRWYTASVAGALLGFVTYLAGCASVGGRLNEGLIVFAAVASLWMACVGAIAKDLSDVKGDMAAGRRSLPAVLGVARACRVMATMALALGTLFGLATVSWQPELRNVAPVLLLGASTVAVLSLKTPHSSDRSVRRSPYRAFMLTQQAANLLLIVSIWPHP
ncbi:UbiA family prenyltransferase [Streptomyces sp. NPDC005474]|uniref:UbiA family prenyltransferase n=1 Tax=Streptomyces sp. NPDC005474 TaxID=3154878 RepID=UPI003452252B